MDCTVSPHLQKKYVEVLTPGTYRILSYLEVESLQK